jgi:hypothetical protein
MVLLVADLYGHNREIDANLRIGEIELDPGAMEPSTTPKKKLFHRFQPFQ